MGARRADRRSPAAAVRLGVSRLRRRRGARLSPPPFDGRVSAGLPEHGVRGRTPARQCPPGVARHGCAARIPGMVLLGESRYRGDRVAVLARARFTAPQARCRYGDQGRDAPRHGRRRRHRGECDGLLRDADDPAVQHRVHTADHRRFAGRAVRRRPRRRIRTHRAQPGPPMRCMRCPGSAGRWSGNGVDFALRPGCRSDTCGSC